MFDHAVGVSPKRFARIVRLQSALRVVPAEASWTSVAHDLGFYDQSTPREIARMTKHTR